MTEPFTENRKWHFNRSINIDTLIAILLMLGGFFMYAMHQQERLVTLENFVKAHESTDKRLADRYEADRLEMKNDINAIREVIDRMAERRR